VLRIFKEGNERFTRGERLQRDLVRQVDATSTAQFPMAVVLSCIDSRTTTELVFDLGLGDIFSIRIAGNVAHEKVFGSMEYACRVAGAKLIVVLGHTRCGAITSACDLVHSGQDPAKITGCDHIGAILDRIRPSIECETHTTTDRTGKNDNFVNRVARLNVEHVMDVVYEQSECIRELMDAGKVGLVGAMYDVKTGRVDYLKKMGVQEIFTEIESDSNDAAPSANLKSELNFEVDSATIESEEPKESKS
jgi:carbonic anhydrase/SulP family sulfate permease